MVIKRFALVRAADGLAVNVCVWDGFAPWEPTVAGVDPIACPEYVGPAWRYIDGEWLEPLPPEPPPEE